MRRSYLFYLSSTLCIKEHGKIFTWLLGSRSCEYIRIIITILRRIYVSNYSLMLIILGTNSSNCIGEYIGYTKYKQIINLNYKMKLATT